MKVIASFVLTLLIITTAFTLSSSTRPESELKSTNNNENGGFGGFFGPGNGFNIPGFGKGFGSGIVGGGYGGGYGGPNGGSGRSGIIRPTIVCKEKGPCYNKKLTCPRKCFTSYSRSGKGYGGGGGGGGCTMDCQKKCSAYC